MKINFSIQSSFQIPLLLSVNLFEKKKKWNEKVEKDTILLASFARIKKNIDRYEKW